MSELSLLPSYLNNLIFLILYLLPGLWLGESSVEFVLALNRCLHIMSPRLEAILFGTNEGKTGYRTYIWLVPPTAWGLHYFLFGTPAVFSSLLHIETFNPHYGYANYMASNVCFLSTLIKFERN